MTTPLDWYAICVVLLFFKMFAISAYQGYFRIGQRTFTTPEDAQFCGRAPAAAELPQVERAARVWRNDLENIPAFFGLGTAYVLVGASPVAAPWLFLGFTTARALHSICYLYALQPWRTVAYAVAVVCLFGMSGAIVAALR